GPEQPLLARELAQEHDLQREIAELFAQLVLVARVDGIDDLARLFEHVAAKRPKILLSIPRTAVRREQALHELDQARERLAALLGQGQRFWNVERSWHRFGPRSSASY